MSFKNEYSNIYDFIYLKKPYQKESKNILSIIRNLNQKTSELTILDYGCGTGKHLGHMSKNFYKCYGYDTSNEMLSFAKKNNKSKNVSFLNNLDKINNNKIDIVIMLFDVFSYFLTKKVIDQNMKIIKRITHSKSIFLFEFWYEKSLKLFPPINFSKNISVNKNKVLKKCDVQVNYLKNIVNIKYSFYKNNIFLFSENHKVRYFNKKEIIKTLKRYNFTVKRFSYLNNYKKTAFASKKYSILCYSHRNI